MTTQNEIREWFDRGKRDGATHMIVACDTYDHDDYPVFVMPGQDVREEEKKVNASSMQKVMEVYAMHVDRELQMRETRAFHYEAPPATRT